MSFSILLHAGPLGRGRSAIAARQGAAPLGRAHGEAADEALIGWAAEGDRLAFDQLALRHLPRLYRVAHRITGDAGAAEEVAQEAMLRAWQAAARFDPSRARFTTWLHRIASNIAIDRVRAVRPSAPLSPELPDTAADPEQRLAARQVRSRLAAALGELPPRQRAALALFYDQEMPGAEAAAALSVSTRALEGLLRRARRFLAARLAG